MGLDGVELVMNIEEAFGITIPDEAAERMITPRDTIDFVCSLRPLRPARPCLTQHIFYRLRQGFRIALAQDLAVRPATPIRELADKHEWPGLWGRIREVAGEPDWPERIPGRSWLGSGPRTLRELAVHIAMRSPSPDVAPGEPWTREQVEFKVRRIVGEVLGVSEFQLDDQYVRDLGVS